MELIKPFMVKYRKRANGHFKAWGLKKNTIIRTPACEDFIRVGQENLHKYGGRYVFILQYACRKLWPDLANAIRDHIPLQTNAYRFWIERYQYEEPEQKMSVILDDLYARNLIDPQLCWQLLEKGLICDINMLKQPFNEEFLPLEVSEKCYSTSSIPTEEG